MIQTALRKLTVGEHLLEAEIFGVIEGIRSGAITDVQIAGFLVALLMKGPTIQEVAAIARAMRASCAQIAPRVQGDLTDTCGTGGGRTTFNCSTAVAAAGGIPAAKHGSRSLASLSGGADVLEELGVATDLTPKQVQELIEACGIGFLYAPNFHPVMHRALPPEMALGILWRDRRPAGGRPYPYLGDARHRPDRQYLDLPAAHPDRPVLFCQSRQSMGDAGAAASPRWLFPRNPDTVRWFFGGSRQGGPSPGPTGPERLCHGFSSPGSSTC